MRRDDGKLGLDRYLPMLASRDMRNEVTGYSLALPS
jgi:hypothetical protein